MTFTVTDQLLNQIQEEVASHAPERGGALLGPKGYPALTDFILDVHAHTSSVVYVPSSNLTDRVAAAERSLNLELKGVLHSHPGLDRLSEQDLLSFQYLLELNPSMSLCAAPIVTQERCSAENDVELPAGKVSFYAVERRREGKGVIKSFRPSIVPVRALVDAIAAEFTSDTVTMLGPTTTFGTMTFDAAALGGTVGDIFVACPSGYPVVAPIILVSNDGRSRQIPLRWLIGIDAIQTVIREIYTSTQKFAREDEKTPFRTTSKRSWRSFLTLGTRPAGLGAAALAEEEGLTQAPPQGHVRGATVPAQEEK